MADKCGTSKKSKGDKPKKGAGVLAGAMFTPTGTVTKQAFGSKKKEKQGK